MTTNPPPDARNARIYMATANVAVMDILSGREQAHTWWWNTWNATTAKSTGTLWVDNCIPNCAYGKESYHKLYVTLWAVKYHNGRAYYSAMTWYTPGYRMRINTPYMTSTTTLHFSVYPGGTVPFWH
jgi:hypothetical protein